MDAWRGPEAMAMNREGQEAMAEKREGEWQ